MIFVNEYQCNGLEDDFVKWINPEKRIQDFLDLFLNSFYFGSLIIIESEFLRNAYQLMKRSDIYRKIDNLNEIKPIYHHIFRACYSHGHLSVVFVMKNAEDFFKKYLGLGYYNYTQSLKFNFGYENFPLQDAEMKIFLDMFSQFNLVIENNMCTFAHDADYFYILKSQNE